MSGLGLRRGRFVPARRPWRPESNRLITLSIQHHNYPNNKCRLEIKAVIARGWRVRDPGTRVEPDNESRGEERPRPATISRGNVLRNRRGDDFSKTPL